MINVENCCAASYFCQDSFKNLIFKSSKQHTDTFDQVLAE